MEHLVAAQRGGSVEIALHGHSHEERVRQAGSLKTEFAGLWYEEQLRLIREGLVHVGGIFPREIEGFVPPWGTYDLNTLKAVRDCGLRYISGALDSGIDFRETLALLPRTCGPRALRSAVVEALRWKHVRPLVVVVLHHFDFREGKGPTPLIDLDEFAGWLQWLATLEDVRVCSLSDAARSLDGRVTGRQARWWRRVSSLPYRVRGVFPAYLVPTVPMWKVLVDVRICRRLRDAYYLGSAG